MKRAVFMPAAEADVEDAFQWHEAQRIGLGATFRHAVDVTVAALEAHPADLLPGKKPDERREVEEL